MHNASEFRDFLIFERYITDLELAVNPGIVCKLMNDDDIWESFKETMEYAEMVQREDTLRYLNLGGGEVK